MHHTFKIGSLTCTSLLDMSGEWDIYALFSKYDEAELEPLLTAVGQDRTWPRQGTALLIEQDGRKIMIDSGLPAGRNGQLLANLAEAGHRPDEIDLIFITHGDGDHIGGLPSFSQAEIVLPKEAYRLWTEDEDGMVADFIKLFEGRADQAELEQRAAGRRVYPRSLPSMRDRIRLVEQGEAFAPGMRFWPAPGHRRDHVIVEINSGEETLLHVADGLRHPIQVIRPDIHSFIDSFPDELKESTEMILERAAQEGVTVFGAHLPFPGLIKIERNGDRYQWVSA